jgi:hypothetical protein
MPRDGSLTPSDLRDSTLTIVCGDAKLTDLLTSLADRPKAESTSIYDRCKAVYGRAIVAAPTFGAMVTIAITPAALAAIKATLPTGSKAEARPDDKDYVSTQSAGLRRCEGFAIK